MKQASLQWLVFGFSRFWWLGGALAACLAVFWCEQQGWLQLAEMRVRDGLVRALAGNHPPDPDHSVSILLFQESDFSDPLVGGYPLSDGTLARLLAILRSGQPSAIGMDLYRNLPIPADRSERTLLSSAGAWEDPVFWIYKFGQSPRGVPPPEELRERPERLGLNDVPLELNEDGIPRRLFLYLDDGQTAQPSLALQLALRKLQEEGVTPQDEAGWLRLGHAHYPAVFSRTGPMRRFDDRGYQVLMDYCGPARLPTFRALDLLSGRLPPSTFHHQVVLVGTDAESLRDFFVTPRRVIVSGAEWHGLAVEQLLAQARGDRPVVRWPEPFWQILWLAFWCFLGAISSLGVNAWWRFWARLAWLPVLLSASLLAMAAAGWWMPSVSPALGALGAASLTGFLHARHEIGERRLLMRLFARSATPQLARDLWKNRHTILRQGRIEPREVEGVVLFSDLEGFSAMGNLLTPARLLDWLDAYLDALSRAILHHQGLVLAYHGDAIMAVFGLPLVRSSEESLSVHCRRAVRAAWAMGEALATTNHEWQAKEFATGQPYPVMRMRIGLHAGRMVAGSLGRSAKMEFTVLGETVNIAARLEQWRKEETFDSTGLSKCRILLSDTVYANAKEICSARPVGTLPLKGTRLVETYRLDGLSG